MAALKALVIGMGVLIVAGTVALAVLLVQRLGGNSPAGAAATSLSLAQPEGARIGGIAATDRALAVWVVQPDGDRVILLDPSGARRIGEIRLRD
ncbi:hypothetical protein GXW78_17525 [Roseomonas terrae]|uniref:Histidine kinase n=1 Tax=Neoroseomonas terrae TaxID=424799 RepID=A0ABS5EKB3_9PROT|nr:hypothetical protein [Neoroseomonas terrae]